MNCVASNRRNTTHVCVCKHKKRLSRNLHSCIGRLGWDTAATDTFSKLLTCHFAGFKGSGCDGDSGERRCAELKLRPG